MRVRISQKVYKVHREFNAYDRPTQETNVHTIYLSFSNILWPCISLK